MPAKETTAERRLQPKPGIGSSPVAAPIIDVSWQKGIEKNGAREPSIVGVTLIGADLTIVGDVISKGNVTLDGEIQGDMHCASLVVGEDGAIEGGVIANEVTVLGRVIGSIRANKVVLQSTAHVEGDIFHQEIGMEIGTVFDGTLKRTQNPTAEMVNPNDIKAGMKTKSSTNGQSGISSGASSSQKCSSSQI